MINVGTATSLPDSANHQLDMYSMAAKAAGVSVLALALPASARIVYTSAHVVLHRGDPGLTKLDLNHDGITDFTFSNFWVSGSNGTQPFGHLSVLPAQAENGAEVKFYSGYSFAAVLRAGVSVGKNGKFITGSRITMDFGNGISTTRCLGPWKDVKDRYLGMKFVIKGEPHFGWARLNVSCAQHNYKTKAVLTGYAYETVANKSIVTGRTKEAADDPTNEDFVPGASLPSSIPDKSQQATLGALATGAPGLSIWRRAELTGGPSLRGLQR